MSYRRTARRLLRSSTLAFVGLTAASASVHAAPFEYVGASAGNWSVSSNWSPATVPNAIDADLTRVHNPGVDGAFTINVDGAFTINSFSVIEADDPTDASNSPVILADPGGVSSLTIADGGTLDFDSQFNRGGTNLTVATDVFFQTLNVSAGNRNAGNGQYDRGVLFTDATFTGDTVVVSGTLALSGTGTYLFDTLLIAGSSNFGVFGPALVLDGIDLEIDSQPATPKRSYLDTDLTVASLTLGLDQIAPGTYTAANAATAPVQGGGTVDLTQWFNLTDQSLTIVPEPAALALLACGLSACFSRGRRR